MLVGGELTYMIRKTLKHPYLSLAGGGGGGGVTQGQFWYRCASQYFETNPNHISGLWKKQLIHILDFTES